MYGDLFSYEYFCGANVTIQMDGMDFTEVAGITFNAVESKRPLYGYSSRHFDGVARGQVLVTGTIVVPFVHHNYVTAIKNVGQGVVTEWEDRLKTFNTELGDPAQLREAAKIALVNSDPELYMEISERLKAQIWDEHDWDEQKDAIVRFQNAYDHARHSTIKILFGEREAFNSYRGKHNIVLEDVHFTSRGMPIQISEDMIVEEYGFFARDIVFERDVKIEATIEEPLNETNGSSSGLKTSTLSDPQTVLEFKTAYDATVAQNLEDGFVGPLSRSDIFVGPPIVRFPDKIPGSNVMVNGRPRTGSNYR